MSITKFNDENETPLHSYQNISLSQSIQLKYQKLLQIKKSQFKAKAGGERWDEESSPISIHINLVDFPFISI